MPLNIPPEDRGAIAAITVLPSSSLEQFIAALKAAPPVSNAHEMAEHIAKQVPKIPAGKLASVLEMLYTLYYIRDLSGVSPITFLDDLLEGISRSSGLKLKAKDMPKLRSLFDKLLSIESLKTVSKAARLQRDGERLYCTAKILSDIRPVFGSDPTTRPEGAVLTHSLKLGYHEGKEHKEFHVVLDSDDLEALAEMVERARLKDKSLRNLLEEAKLPNLGD